MTSVAAFALSTFVMIWTPCACSRCRRGILRDRQALNDSASTRARGAARSRSNELQLAVERFDGDGNTTGPGLWRPWATHCMLYTF